MADEMDDPRDAEEQAATPVEKKKESAKASPAAGGESEMQAKGSEPAPSGEDSAAQEATVAEAAEAFSPEASEAHRAEAASGAGVTRGEESTRVEAGELDKPGLDLLYDVELDATLQFGSKEMLLRDVLELGPGDVVELERHIAEPVDLVVGDRIVARGEVVVASGNFALRVTEVATPQMRLESIRCLF